eukprot:TRINITY_DN555_c0_g2_i4.p2 TRINITY_DN555_c0_g2~~TRINITY_DN555_c0_g2_i4.p2  ORF type:complete len:189 (-),score=30.81 TRINITY_DN555_c0_g2_i4:59-625(-)
MHLANNIRTGAKKTSNKNTRYCSLEKTMVEYTGSRRRPRESTVWFRQINVPIAIGVYISRYSTQFPLACGILLSQRLPGKQKFNFLIPGTLARLDAFLLGMTSREALRTIQALTPNLSCTTVGKPLDGGDPSVWYCMSIVVFSCAAAGLHYVAAERDFYHNANGFRNAFNQDLSAAGLCTPLCSFSNW